MFNWLKRRLRKWLAEDDTPSMVLDIMLAGGIKKVVVKDKVGMRLLCDVPTTAGCRVELIGETQACDRNHYWRLWKQLGGRAQWEDGQTFTPPE